MYLTTIIALMIILFILFFIIIRSFLRFLTLKTLLRSRLQYHLSISGQLAGLASRSRYHILYRHVSDLFEAVSVNMKINTFFIISLLLFFFGLLFGSFFFQNLKGALLLTIIMASTPYLILRMRVISLQMKARIDFLPAVEVFYEHYVVAANKNVISILKGALQGNRILYPIKPIFDQLQRNLSTNRQPDDCLRIFTLSLGHIWADYYSSILRFGLIEGIDVTSNLKQLIGDMRKAQRADQVERHRLLEIRLANFSSVFILVIFLAINFRINYSSSYYYYVLDPAGRSMLLDGVFLIFLSFLMGVYLSVRRM